MTGNGPFPLPFARRVLLAAAITAGVVLLLLFTWFTADLLLLAFAAVLVSSLLRGLSRGVQKYTGLGHGLSLFLVSLALLLFTIGFAWFAAGQVGTQLAELLQQLPQGLEYLRKQIEQIGWARDALHNLPDPNEWFTSRSDSIIARFTGIASTTVGAVLNTVVIAVIGLYLASQPWLYSRGLIRLIPIHSRARAREVLNTIDDTLWRWLIGRLRLMVLNATLTTVGLSLLGIPFALTLGAMTGLLNFIPNIGPWIAAIPAVLIGLLQSPWQGFYVALLYLVLQSVDGYVLTPLVDRRSVKLPPVLTITAQVLLGATFGFMGLLLASPLTTTAMILVKMIYVEDVLGDRSGLDEDS